jgi:hypothetical protein
MILIFDIPVGMYMHSIFHSCSVITVTTNIYIFDIIRLPVSALYSYHQAYTISTKIKLYTCVKNMYVGCDCNY